MFKYIKFEKVETEFTVLEFRAQSEDVKVNSFDVNVVSLEAENAADIDALVAMQDSRILCEEITHDDFKDLVTVSSQLERIRDVVAAEVAKKYSFAEEFGMSKRDVSDAKRIEYEAYIKECLSLGYGLKAEIGY